MLLCTGCTTSYQLNTKTRDDPCIEYWYQEMYHTNTQHGVYWLGAHTGSSIGIANLYWLGPATRSGTKTANLGYYILHWIKQVHLIL